jgi:hypothetical protein
MAREVCMAFGQAVSLLVDQDDQLIDCEGERHCSSDFINSLLIPISCDQLLYLFKTWFVFCFGCDLLKSKLVVCCRAMMTGLWV